MLSPQQAAAVAHRGPLVLVAGPGSGKTQTICARARRILLERDDHTILAATFSREGAHALTERLRRLLPASAMKRVRADTFHAFVFAHLREQGHLPNKGEARKHGQLPHLATPQYQREVLDRVKPLAPEPDRKELQLVFEEIKCSFDPHPRSGEAWIMRYNEILARHGMIDFYDAMREAVVRMKQGTLAPMRASHLLLDEMQDNDDVQQQLAGVLIRSGMEPTGVGDDDQTIYEWRRALGYKGMMSFAETYGAKVMRLTENYRSKRLIVVAASGLISANKERVKKILQPKAGEGGSIVLVEYEGPKADGDGKAKRADRESVGALELAARLWDASTRMPKYEDTRLPYGFPDATYAVLARNNRDLDDVQAALAAKGVRHHRATGSIYDRPVIQRMFSLLVAAEGGSVAGLESTLAACKVSEHALDALAQQHGRGDVSVRLAGAAAAPGVPPADAQLLRRLGTLMTAWANNLAAGQVNLAGLAASRWIMDHHPMSDGRKPYESRRLERAVEALLRQNRATIEKRVEAISMESKPKTPEDAVEIMTVHGSKGREWDHVTIFRADEGVFPSAKVAEGTPQYAAHIEGERRLFYVGSTRARHTLHFYSTKGCVSRFVMETLAAAERGAKAA